MNVVRSSLLKGSAAVLLALTLCACGGGGTPVPDSGSVDTGGGTPVPDSGSGGSGGGTPVPDSGSGGTGGGTPVPVVLDTTAPTAEVIQTDAVLGKNTPIVIRFSESMDPASPAAQRHLGDRSQWRRLVHDRARNDTLTVSPQTGNWSSGDGRSLTVNAKDVAGNALATLSANYLVKLVFDNFQSAAFAIGQADLTSGFPNQQASPGANTLFNPDGNPVVTPDGRLFIGDYENNRVLAFNSLPAANNASADFVLGQPDSTSGDPRITSLGSHNGARQVVTVNGKFIVADSESSRVVIYDTIPTSGTARQSVVVGQPNFDSDADACNNSSLKEVRTVAATPDGKLIVTDSGNNRVLIWNAVPTIHGQAADVVLGQAELAHCTENDDNQDGAADETPSADAQPSARTLSWPAGVWSDGKRLVVVDSNNFRVLIWNQVPASNFQPADVVLGQNDFTHGTSNDFNQDNVVDEVPTNRTLNFAYNGVSSNGVQLAIADSRNNRVLIWNSFPTTNFQAADVVLGQSDFAHRKANDVDQDGFGDQQPSAHTLDNPAGVLFYRNKLLVVDNDNHRVLIFNSK